MQEDKRRVLIESVREKAQRAGLKFEDDSAFTTCIDLWVEGRIDVKELRDRYLGLLLRRCSARRIGFF